jgi:hypothetical protein
MTLIASARRPHPRPTGKRATAISSSAGSGTNAPEAGDPKLPVDPEPDPLPLLTRRPTRFHATVELDPMRLAFEAGRVNDQVISHLSSKLGSRVRVTLEIHVDRSEGFDDKTVRVVSEKAAMLKFDGHGFEQE